MSDFDERYAAWRATLRAMVPPPAPCHVDYLSNLLAITFQEGQDSSEARALKAEAALREIDKIGYSKRGGQAGAMQRIARAALEGK